MKKLELNQELNLFGQMDLNTLKISLNRNEMEEVQGGRALDHRDYGCASYGLAAGIAAGFNPLVGGLTTLGCYLLS
jgi:hypothetical protein